MQPPGNGGGRGAGGGDKDTLGQEETTTSCILLRHWRVQLLTHIPPLYILATLHECTRSHKRVESKALGVPCPWVREARECLPRGPTDTNMKGTGREGGRLGINQDG